VSARARRVSSAERDRTEQTPEMPDENDDFGVAMDARAGTALQMPKWKAPGQNFLCAADLLLEAANGPPECTHHARVAGGNVRLFRDLDSFMTHDGSFSIGLPQKSLEEVLAPG
jgi:hypothetical protein